MNNDPTDVSEALESLFAANDDRRAGCVTDLLSALCAAYDSEQCDMMRSALARSVLPTLDYTSAQSLYRAYRKLPQRAAPGATPIRLAILGSSNTDRLAQFIELVLFSVGADVAIYTSDYGVFRQEILDAHSNLYSFRPTIAVLATSWRDLAHVPPLTDDFQAVQDRVEAELADWSALWRAVHDRMGCQIIQNGFDPPPWRVLGNYDSRHVAGFTRYVALVNQALSDRAPPYVAIHDTAALSAAAGRWEWADERFYHQAKLPCAPEFLFDYAHSLGSLTAAFFGLGKKCLVVDLDNTLWGGVIGDDGLRGIRVGPGDVEGEAFQAFQRYLKGLQSRGVILAVCSKNDERVAREAFTDHPDMVLRLTDFASFVANWDDKPANLAAIAKQLNIGLNSMVFVDDNPAERSIVRQMLSEVSVPELPEDPAGYIRAVERFRYFELSSLASEDFQRTEYYRGNGERERAQLSAESVDNFLESLQMKASIMPIAADNIDRCVQLIGRSNQFNLTTRRYSVAEVETIASSRDWITAAVTLTDRFGDNGLISVLLAKVTSRTLEIDTWLMSCRVLKRGIESLLLNHVYEAAQARGLTAIRGEYLPTPKNALVNDHFRKLGFDCIETSPDGRSQWMLPVIPDWQPRPHQIRKTQSIVSR